VFQHELPAKLDTPVVIADVSEIENRVAGGSSSVSISPISRRSKLGS